MTRSALTPLAGSFLAIVAAFLTGGLFLFVVGKDPINAYRLLVSRSLGSSLGITESLIRMAPLLFVGAGLLIALKAGVWNIGVDGQFLIGAVLVGVTAPELLGEFPGVVVFLVSAVVGFGGGVVWAVVPALLKVRYGLNEIITTIMMNYVAINLTSWLVKGPFKDPDVVPPQTVLIPRADRLPTFGLSRVHIGLLVALLAVVLVVVLFRFTTLGFKFWVLGQNQRAAVHAGLPVGGLTILALLLSGGCAGLAGANDVLGVKGLFQGNWFPNYGFTGFALVYLARLNGLWVIPFALFFSFLAIGGEFMSRAADIPTYFVELLEGLMLAYFAVAVYVERRYLGSVATRRQVAARLEPEAVEST